MTIVQVPFALLLLLVLVLVAGQPAAAQKPGCRCSGTNEARGILTEVGDFFGGISGSDRANLDPYGTRCSTEHAEDGANSAQAWCWVARGVCEDQYEHTYLSSSLGFTSRKACSTPPPHPPPLSPLPLIQILPNSSPP